MKNLYVLLTLLLSTQAFAVDQVILKNGQKVEGKVLADVPNRHVDLELPNGNKVRYEQTEVASVERDVPSRTKDSDFYGVESQAYIGVLGGGGLFITSSNSFSGSSTSNSSTDFRFSYGVRVGANVAQIGNFSKLGVGLEFARSSGARLATTDQANGITHSVNEVLVQILFRKVANSGFYFGPQLGIMIIDTSFLGTSNSTTKFDLGGVIGYDFYFTPSFSMGPEIDFTAPASSGDSFVLTKFLLSATVHL